MQEKVYKNGGKYISNPDDTKQVFHYHLFDSKFHNSVTTTHHIGKILEVLFINIIMKRGGFMWDQANGCG